MLSIAELIDAGTITGDSAAYSVAAINSGTSFMVGAIPGGTGKTTMMRPLPNFVHRDVQFLPAENITVVERGMINWEPRYCHICHEIGNGSYYAYL